MSSMPKGLLECGNIDSQDAGLRDCKGSGRERGTGCWLPYLATASQTLAPLSLGLRRIWLWLWLWPLWELGLRPVPSSIGSVFLQTAKKARCPVPV